MSRSPLLRLISLGALCWLAACQPASDPGPLPTLASLDALVEDARDLQFWEAADGALRVDDERALWKFGAPVNAMVRLKLVQRGGALLTMRLSTPTGALLAEGDEIAINLPLTGVYSVEVVRLAGQEGAAAYQIGLGYLDRTPPPATTPLPEIVGVPTPTPPYATLGRFVRALRPGEEAAGRLDENARPDIYAFEGRAGDLITLELRRLSGTIDPLLRLYAPGGEALAVDSNSAGGLDARLRNLRLPLDGEYSIQVSGTGSGEYRLRLAAGEQPVTVDRGSEAPEATPTAYLTPLVPELPSESRLVDHQPVIGALARSGDFARYSFTANATERVSIAVVPAGDGRLRPAFELYGPEGEAIGSARGSTSAAGGAALGTGIPIPSSGTYVLLILGDDGTSGSFLVGFGRGVTYREIYQGEPPPETRLAGLISTPGVRDLWRLPLRAGDVITVAVSPTSDSFDPVIELATEDGIIFERDDNSGGGRAALIRLANIERDGVVHLRVFDALGRGQGGYALIWRYINRAATPTPLPANVPLLYLSDSVEANAYQFYPFQGEAGQQIRVQVLARPGSNLDPVATLLDPQGQEFASGDDSPNSLNPDLFVTLPETGTYTLRVNGYLSAGPYDVRVDWLLPGGS